MGFRLCLVHVEVGMIRVSVLNDRFNRAFWNAKRTLPVKHLETPRQYGQRCREAFRYRVDPSSPQGALGTVYYIFDQDEDYTWFMLRWG
jgi:hypothetical protein